MGRPSKYPEEFRHEAVELVRTSGRPVVDVARSLGITDSTLRNWLKADRDARARAADPDGLSESELDELARLRKENIELRTDREILRQAAAYFARETMREPLPLRR
jgi:transposase